MGPDYPTLDPLSKRDNVLPWYLRPEPKVPDIRDQEEHADVAAALTLLPEGHAARQAYSQGAGTIALTHLVREYPTVVEALTEAYLAGYRRLLQRSGSFRP